MTNIGDKIKQARVKSKLTQKALADLLFVSDKTISSWESNRTVPDINTIFQLSNLLKVNFYSLICEYFYNSQPIEIEIKLKVELKEYQRILDIMEKQSTYLGIEDHVSTYYKPSYRKFSEEYLRIRNENGKHVLNYKKKRDNSCCDEYETLVDNPDCLEKILISLGMRKIGVIKKTRKKYLYDNKFEISFDDVENIGLFIEVETKRSDSDPKDEYNQLMTLLCQLHLNLNLIEKRRYCDYLIEGELE